MLRPASCDARRLRRSAAWPARIGADADESAAAVCASEPSCARRKRSRRAPAWEFGHRRASAQVRHTGMDARTRDWVAGGRAVGPVLACAAIDGVDPRPKRLRVEISVRRLLRVVPLRAPSSHRQRRRVRGERRTMGALRCADRSWTVCGRCARIRHGTHRIADGAHGGRSVVGCRRAARATRTPSSYARLPCGCRGCRRTGRACWGSPGWIGIARLAATAADP